MEAVAASVNTHVNLLLSISAQFWGFGDTCLFLLDAHSAGAWCLDLRIPAGPGITWATGLLCVAGGTGGGNHVVPQVVSCVQGRRLPSYYLCPQAYHNYWCFLFYSTEDV